MACMNGIRDQEESRGDRDGGYGDATAAGDANDVGVPDEGPIDGLGEEGTGELEDGGGSETNGGCRSAATCMEVRVDVPSPGARAPPAAWLVFPSTPPTLAFACSLAFALAFAFSPAPARAGWGWVLEFFPRAFEEPEGTVAGPSHADTPAVRVPSKGRLDRAGRAEAWILNPKIRGVYTSSDATGCSIG
jgi:hypothetical protein